MSMLHYMFIPPGIDSRIYYFPADTLLTDELKKKVRVCALILTMPISKLTKAVHVKATWARRFNGYVFISSEDDPSLPSIRVVETESRAILWEKTRQAFMYAKKNFLNDYDFFMKADDDSYVIVENLRFILSKMDPSVPFIMGRRFKKYVKQGYLSGGAGYVVSRAALKLIAEGMEKEVVDCQKRGGAEDVNLGACAERVGVKMIDSLDEHGEEAFHPFYPAYMLDKAAMDHTRWVHSYNYYPIKTGFDCCSDHSVSFHYVSSKDMYMLDYLIYHLYPYDDRTLADKLAEKVRIFGMIITMPQNKLTKAIHAKETWARRLNGYIFISSEDDKNLRSIRVVEKEGRYMLWEKTRQAIIYAYRNHADDYDYFMKADDDTYVIVENLRYILSTRIPDEPFFMGRRFIELIDRNPWIHSYNYHPMKTGLDCCSDHTASFHYISPDWMYVLEFLVYHLYPYGIARDLQQYETLLNMSKTKTDKI
ncbi:unnamed protein product [Hymenolepis diminuta]|uniref:N-acetylgalactosaminide beta-1,3-galactosyltransferase n=1 Tax=Hymenolepis diminuta TaxID=6216 RepID=A0A158QDG4_HYMDI|nr:unnamed protein product [Hymenolepis diminuta]